MIEIWVFGRKALLFWRGLWEFGRFIVGLWELFVTSLSPSCFRLQERYM
jgi:hypothetical protein